MGLRKAEYTDLPVIMQIIDEAKEKLRLMGVDQWQDGYPNMEVIEADIDAGEAYVWTFPSSKTSSAPSIIAYIMFSFNPDPDYAVITDGEWLNQGDYAVFHRLAVASAYRGEGYAGQVLRRVLDLAMEAGFDSLRADTHSDNISMQHTLENNGFERCGRVLIRGSEPRIAYEYRFRR